MKEIPTKELAEKQERLGKAKYHIGKAIESLTYAQAHLRKVKAPAEVLDAIAAAMIATALPIAHIGNERHELLKKYDLRY